MKRFLIVIVAILSIFSFSTEVSASQGSLSGVHSEAFINKDGTVDIKQTWNYNDTSVSSGTEHYINMNASYGEEEAAAGYEAITDYVVYRNGQKMEWEEAWNINASFDHKAGKYGVVPVGTNEIELTFAITEKTKNEFVLEYKVHNVIKETEDGYKYLHWTFLPTELSPEPGFLTAEIKMEDGVEVDKIYGFNYKGKVGFLDDQRNAVYAEMDRGSYDKESTLNIFTLLKDEDGLITNTKSVNMTLEEKAKEILSGSDYDLEHFNSEHFEEIDSVGTPWWKKQSTANIVKGLTPFLGMIGFFLLIKRLGGRRRRRLTKNMDKSEIKELRKGKDFYHRDEPDELYYSTELMRDLLTIDKLDNNILSFYISKWTYEGVFEYIDEVEETFLFMKKNTVTFQIHPDKLNSQSTLEENLFKEFNELTDGGGIMTTSDLKRLSMTRLSQHLSKHKVEAYEKLDKLGYVVDHGSKTTHLTKKGKDGIGWKSNPKPVLTDKGEELIYQHAGLKNYLEQFTLMNERSTNEIELWDYYFYMAALYGIAEEFKKDLKNMPNISEEGKQKYNRYYGNTGTAVLASSVSQSVSDSYTSHNSRSSSSGGGGGSSGGGSGGGTR